MVFFNELVMCSEYLGILILLITIGEIALIVVELVIRLLTVQQLNVESLVMYVAVCSTFQSTARRFVIITNHFDLYQNFSVLTRPI